MADLAEIGIGVDVAQVKTAKQELQALGTAFNSAERSAGVFTQAFDKAFKTAQKDIEYIKQSARAFQDVVNQVNGVSNSYKSAEQSASAFMEVLRNQEAQAKKTAIAIDSITGVTGTKATSSGAGFGALDSEMVRLEARFDGLKMASALYEKELSDLNMAQANGIRITGGYEASLEKLNLEYQQFQNGITGAGNRFEVQTQLNTKGMNRMGLATQQLGYQMGDFLVQVQSGTNWMVAFGQQATQAVAVLPMFATQLGMSATSLLAWATGLGIAIPLVTALGAAWMRTHEDTKKAKKSLTEMEEQIKSIDGTLKDWLRTKEAAKAGVTVEEMFGTKSLSSAKEEYEKVLQEIQKIKVALDAGTISYTEYLSALDTSGLSDKIKAAWTAVEEAQKRLNDLKEKQLEDYNKEAQSQKDLLALAQLSIKYGEDSFLVKQKQAEIDRNRYEESQKSEGILGKQLEDLMKIYDEQVRLNRVLEEGKGWVENTKDILSDVLRMDASSSFLSKAKQAMADLKTAAEAAALATQKALMAEQADSTMSGPSGNIADIPQAYGLGYLGGIPPEYAGSPSGLAPGQTVRPKAAPVGLGGVDWGYAPSKGGGGSKGPSEDTIEKRLKKLYEYMGDLEKYQIEAENIAYKQREDTLKQALDKKLITLQEYNDLEKELKEKHEAELQQIAYASQAQQLTDAGTFFGSLASVAQAGGNGMVKAAAVFSAAQALINSWVAYTEMLKDPSFVSRPWARFAAAASVLAAGLNAVQAIRSVGSGGGSSSGSTRTSTVSSATQAAPQTYYISGLEPDSLYSGETLQNLFDAITQENSNRGGVFVFARQ